MPDDGLKPKLREPFGPKPKLREPLGYLLMLSGIVGYYVMHDVMALGLQLTAGATVLDLKLPRYPGPW